MARSIFIGFHYQQDIWRVNVIRNQYLTKGGYEVAGYWDHSLWEKIKKSGVEAIEHLINDGLKGTTVTVVLIGSQTAERRWVKYEIKNSYEKGNGLLGIYIHKIEDQSGLTSAKGQNPFGNFTVGTGSQKKYLSDLVATYDWIDDEGYENFGSWIEKAAKASGH